MPQMKTMKVVAVHLRLHPAELPFESASSAFNSLQESKLFKARRPRAASVTGDQ
jgi:hypothetical protein